MGVVTESWKAFFRKSLDWDYYRVFLFFHIIYLVIVGIILSVVAGLFIGIAGIPPADPDLFPAYFLSLFSIPNFLTGFLIVMALTGIAFIFITALASGMMLYIARLATPGQGRGALEIIRKAYSYTMPRLLGIVKTHLLVALVVMVPLLVVMLIFASIGIRSAGTLLFIALLVPLAILFWLGFLIWFLPSLMLSTLVPLFEGTGAFDSLRRMLSLAGGTGESITAFLASFS